MMDPIFEDDVNAFFYFLRNGYLEPDESALLRLQRICDTALVVNDATFEQDMKEWQSIYSDGYVCNKIRAIRRRAVDRTLPRRKHGNWEMTFFGDLSSAKYASRLLSIVDIYACTNPYTKWSEHDSGYTICCGCDGGAT